MKEPVEKKPVSGEGEAEGETKESVTRRKMFGAGLFGVASMLAAACSGTDFAGGNALGGKKKKKDENGGEDAADGPDGEDAGGVEGGKLDVEDGDDPNGPPNEETGLDQCAANVTTEIDPNGDDIGSLKPTVRFYGNDSLKSTLVAIKFPGSDPINQVIIATKEGKLIAVHTVTGADKKGDGSYRPIVMDNLSLTKGGEKLAEIRIILQTPSGKKAHSEPVALYNTHNGKTVFHLGNQTVPAQVTVDKQSVTQFDADKEKFKPDTGVVYPNDFNTGVVRNLRTVKTDTVWTREAGVKGQVTDIMGTEIAAVGQPVDILEYQIFCTYVETTGGLVRTILHIG